MFSVRGSGLRFRQVKLKKAPQPPTGLNFDEWALRAYVCMCGILCVLCLGFVVCYVWDLACLMWI